MTLSSNQHTDIKSENYANNTPSIDHAQFKELQELLEEDFNGLVLSYIDESQHRVLGLKEAFENKDNKAGYDLAHYLKGASANLGLTRLNKLCFIMQQACREKKISQTAELVAQIEAEVLQTNIEIKALLGDVPD